MPVRRWRTTSNWARNSRPLRDRGVLVVGSGNVVHNLRRMDRHHADSGLDWADRFDAHVRDLMTTRPADLAEVASHPDCALAVPTPEHFLPLAYIAGMCAAAGETPQVFNDARTMGSLSMTSYLLGMPVPPCTRATTRSRCRRKCRPSRPTPDATALAAFVGWR